MYPKPYSIYVGGTLIRRFSGVTFGGRGFFRGPWPRSDRVQGFGFRVQGLEFTVWGSGFREDVLRHPGLWEAHRREGCGRT